MQEMTQIASVRAPAIDPGLAEALARETAAPIEVVSRIYREELNALARKARITQFLEVIVSRRVRLRLQRSQPRASHKA